MWGGLTMNKEYISATIQKATYEHKEGTEVSFYWKAGARILPNRMSIKINGLFADARHTGRMISKNEPVVGDLKGEFTKVEDSPLKQEAVNGRYGISTKLFQSADYPQFCYGVIAVSNAETGRTNRQEGMLVIRQVSESVLDLYYMQGVTENPSDKMLVFEVINELISNDLKK